MNSNNAVPMAMSSYLEALTLTEAMTVLAPFEPRVAGALPLGLAVPTSDIDILCYAPDPGAFAATLWMWFQRHPGFLIRQRVGADRAIICSFNAYGWPFEVFGQAMPVTEQQGWRHFTVARRLLELGGDSFRAAVVASRHTGEKTESAFAIVLKLRGDPYQALLDLEPQSDGELIERLNLAGFRRISAPPHHSDIAVRQSHASEDA